MVSSNAYRENKNRICRDANLFDSPRIAVTSMGGLWTPSLPCAIHLTVTCLQDGNPEKKKTLNYLVLLSAVRFRQGKDHRSTGGLKMAMIRAILYHSNLLRINATCGSAEAASSAESRGEDDALSSVRTRF